MRRYWIDSQVTPEQSTIAIEGDSLHHIRDVCRLGVGSKFEILTPNRNAYFVEITEMNKKLAVAHILEVRPVPEIAGPRVHLCLSVPKFATLEKVIEKSVELGVASLIPFFSDFSFVSHANKISESRFIRWQKIVKSATQQSGRGDLMPIVQPRPLSTVLESFNQNNGLKGLFAYEGASKTTVREVLQDWGGNAELHDLYLFVGSEGGFSEAEVESFHGVGLEPASLGDQILRVETACTALVSIIKYEVKAFG